ncbi:MAG: IS110 family transposase [Moheibacter sp.]
MKILKQVLGVDVAQKELVVSLGKLPEDLNVNIYSHRVFANKESGFKALLKWLLKNTDDDIPIRIVMEATGVYHQKFANFMVENGVEVSVVLPNKISNFMRTLQIKTITDRTCGDAIARFGLERNLDVWEKPDPIYAQLQQLTRERDQIVDQRTMTKNRLHAEKSEACPNQGSIKRMNSLIKFLDKQEQEIKSEIKRLISSNTQIKEQVDRMTTIPGLGELTAVIILAETNGFELIRNKKQLTSYAGMDIKEKQSGTSVKGKPRLSKKGNKHIRRAMHLPSLAAVRHCLFYKEVYARLVSKHGVKMKALIAIQRKMLELSYILVKNQSQFEPDYEQKRELQKLANSL